MKTYNKIKTLALGSITMISLASCSLDYEPISEPSEITQGTQTETSTAVLRIRLPQKHNSSLSMSCSAIARNTPISIIF